MKEVLIFFGVIGGFVGMCILMIGWAWKDSEREEREKEAKRKAEAEAWLAIEMSKPKYFVHVVLKDGEPFDTEVFEPYYELQWRWEHKVTSKKYAHNTVNYWMKENRVKIGSVYYPTCEVVSLEVKEYRE